MSMMRHIPGLLGCLIVALLLLWVGASVPVHFRAVAPEVVEAAGRGTETVVDRAELFLDVAKTGPAEILLELAPEDEQVVWERERLQRLLNDRPHFRHSGGPDPFFERFLDRVEATATGRGHTAMEVILPEAHRAALHGFLQHSANSVVQSILRTRELSALTLFMPVESAAGQPLETSILVAALLAQGEHFHPEVARSLRTLADRAGEGDRPALDQLEITYMALLSLSRRLNWTQLSEFTGTLPSLRALQESAGMVRQDERFFPIFYGASLLTRDPAGLLEYLREGGESSRQNLTRMLPHGAGAVSELVRRGQPLYEAPRTMAWLEGPLALLRQEWMAELTYRQPVAALGLKLGAFLGSGLFLSGMIHLLVNAGRRAPRSLRFVRLTTEGLVFGILLGVILEPALLQLTGGGTTREPTESYGFALSLSLDKIQTTLANPFMIDQATILILLLFFVMQLMVYTFGLIKILEIKRQEVTADLKIKLLENEENLFDLGLYVGLGGTVASLILLAMGVVQASLIAAYASTFFGIICTAFLKIINLRPYRKRLILKRSGQSATETEGVEA